MNLQLFQTKGKLLHMDQVKECAIFEMVNKTGEGTMIVYEVFPGCMLSYNDFHMQYYQSEYLPGENIFCIDHCREGRMEYDADERAYAYVAAGDLKLDRRIRHSGCFDFPLSHYHGITITFLMDSAPIAIKQEIKNFPINIVEIQNKFCTGSHPIVLHQAPAIEHIFSELYNVPLEIKLPYFKIKIFELLLYLQALALPDSEQLQPYFYRGQVEKIKAIEKLMTANLERHLTQEELSKQFDIPLTPMKNCFKSVFGSPIGSYMRIYRMNQAAVLLKQNQQMNISEIAGRVGYDSPSKFATAFKEVMGLSPLAYRKRPKE